jgi:hypothetical protein
MSISKNTKNLIYLGKTKPQDVERISAKALLQVEIFCNDIVRDYEDTGDYNDYDDRSGGWYESAKAILKLIEEKRKAL